MMSPDIIFITHHHYHSYVLINGSIMGQKVNVNNAQFLSKLGIRVVPDYKKPNIITKV